MQLLAGNVSTGAPLPALDEKVNGVKDDDDGSLPPQETEDNNGDDNLPPRAMEDDGEDDNIPALETAASPGPEIRHWMKCLAFYPRALHSLETQVNIHRDRQFRIKVVEPVSPSEPFQQASLQQTLSALSDGSGAVIVRYRELIRRAAQRISLTRPPDDKIPNCLIGELNEREWDSSFQGSVHREACLACVMIQDSGVPIRGNSIGTSKHCCATCTWFLQPLNPEIRYSTTYGKVYPWALPNTDVTPGVKQQVLNKLTGYLKALLDQLARERNCHTESASRSDTSRDSAEAATAEDTEKMNAEELALADEGTNAGE
ncbi:hypothetical protein FRB95_013083 [Tulasnella sp. JGI-2019a]|nr:hypothetical protein FRB95_013083 [Tulasnella sp. JGI-2019a]